MDEVTRARAQLIKGNNRRATEFFIAASRQLQLEASKEKNQQESALKTCKAALLLFEGGRYHDAYGVFSRVNYSLLDKRWSGIANHYCKIASIRSTSTWVMQRTKEIQKFVTKKRWKQVIDALSETPYVFDSSTVAEMRAAACEGMGNKEAAAAFLEDAVRLKEILTPQHSSSK